MIELVAGSSSSMHNAGARSSGIAIVPPTIVKKCLQNAFITIILENQIFLNQWYILESQTEKINAMVECHRL